jgi:hypothetical protein
MLFFLSAWRLATEFQGPLQQERCTKFKDKLRMDGDPEADSFECENKIWMHASGPALWSIAVYYIIVTLTTCVS